MISTNRYLFTHTSSKLISNFFKILKIKPVSGKSIYLHLTYFTLNFLYFTVLESFWPWTSVLKCLKWEILLVILKWNYTHLFVFCCCVDVYMKTLWFLSIKTSQEDKCNVHRISNCYLFWTGVCLLWTLLP